MRDTDLQESEYSVPLQKEFRMKKVISIYVVEQREPDLFLLGCIKTDLEEEFGKKVDIVRFRKKMNSFLKNRIEREAVYV